MATGFSPKTIDLTGGVRQDVSAFALSHPEYLEAANNVVMIRDNEIRGRPTAVAKTLISTTTTALAGIENVNGKIVVTNQGAAFQLDGAAWHQLGLFWSAQKVTSPVFDYRLSTAQVGFGLTVQAAVAVGRFAAAIPVTLNAGSTSTGFPLLATPVNGAFLGLTTTALTNFDSTSAFNVVGASATKDAFLYPKADGSLRLMTVDSAGASAEFLIAAAGSVSVSTTVGQACWLVAGQSGTEFFFAYKSSIAGSIVVGRVTDAGSVTATLTLPGLGTVAWGVALAHNGGVTGSTGKLCLGWNDATAGFYKTKIITVTSTAALTDAGIGVTHDATPGPPPNYLPHAIGYDTTSVKFIPVYFSTVSGAGGLSFDLRSPTLAVSADGFFVLWNTVSSGVAFGTKFYPAGPPVMMGGRLVAPVFRTNSSAVGKTQWILVDLTGPQNQAPAGVVAAGPPDGCALTVPGNPVRYGINDYSFGLMEGVTFDVNGVQSGGTVAQRVTLKPSRGVQVGTTAIFSGVTPYQHDGDRTLPAQFVEGFPTIDPSSVFGGAGGSFQAKSYTFQAIWEIVNARGQVMRSGSSAPFTATAAAGNKFTAVVSVPQLSGILISSNYNVRIKVYQTIAAPSAGAPLYLAGTSVIPGINFPTAGAVSLLLANDTDQTQEQLYANGGVYDDRMPPSADRGVAFAAGRLWTAGADKIYASKILRPGFVPAWNASGGLALPVPPVIGEVAALGSLVDRLLVIGTRGLAVVYGAGLDDLGNGPGFAVEVTSTDAYIDQSDANASPRMAVTIPSKGVAFVGYDTAVRFVNHDGTPQIASRPLRDTVLSSAPAEIAYVEAGGDGGLGSNTAHGPLLVINGDPLQVYNVEAQAWVTWTGTTISQGGSGTFGTGVNGTYTHVVDPQTVYAFSNWTTGLELGVDPVPMTITTGLTGIAGQDSGPLGWGRLRSINPVGRVLGACTLTVTATDEGDAFLINAKTANLTGGTNVTWPTSKDLVEFRTTRQRCSTFRVQLTASPALASWNQIDYWAMAAPERAPAKTRK